MNKLWCRTYQFVMRVFCGLAIWRKPEVLKGENSIKQIPALLKQKGIDNLMIVTDSGISALGLHNGLMNALNESQIKFVVYDKTVPNPTISNIEEALEMYKEQNCQAIIAIGGGSAMDCAKGLGARVARPKKSVTQMKGLLKVGKRLPLLVAIPTTAGTGSETTLAAVITDERTREKYPINDFKLIPRYAVLDPLITLGLPKQITSTTGVDALTHAVEAYIGRSNTKTTRQDSVTAVKLIFKYLYKAYENGQDIEAREKMQTASFLAGAAFTRVYVGYVHAIAHTLGGAYKIPHGLANAVILPYVLDYYGKAVYKPLSQLADAAAICESGDSMQVKAEKFIAAIRELNKKMNIPEKLKGIVESEIPMLVDRAYHEGNPLYPVPKLLNKTQLRELFDMVRERESNE